MREVRWTEEQARALVTPGPVLLAAAAGTGKTTTVVGKILWRLGLDVGVRAADGLPVPPCADPCDLEAVAAITFTEKAAYDLKDKLRREIEASERPELRWEIDRASVGTIHAFCGELLREHALRLGIDPSFRVLEARETRLRQDETIRRVLLERLERGDEDAVLLVERLGLYGSRYQTAAVDLVRTLLRDVRWRGARYDGWTAAGRLDPAALERRARALDAWAGNEEDEASDRLALEATAAAHAVAVEARRRWLAWLREEGARDFDSLILDARRLLLGPDARTALEGIRRRYRLLIIDEFQDTDRAQRDIAFAIAGLPTSEAADGSATDAPHGATGADHEVPAGPRERGTPEPPQLLLVGDPKQSIYGFRGADISVWNQAAAALCGGDEPLRLSHNFRSQPAVVRFVNRATGPVLEARAAALAEELPEHRVPYRGLVPARPALPGGGVEWLATDEEDEAAARRAAEGRHAAAWIRRLVEERGMVADPETGRARPAAGRDVAVLARRHGRLEPVRQALRELGIPHHATGTAGLADRQEVLDLVTVLRLLDDPHDDYHAFAFLRSPFVGLRDETLARLRTDEVTGRGSLLRQAERWLEAVRAGRVEPFPAPESPAVAEVETEALATALEAWAAARDLVDRADPAELLEEVVRRTGYRVHLRLRPDARESLASVERFLALLAEHRHLPLGSFLELWDRWGERDVGVPQAPVHGLADDAVTLSTVHGAKGLEWPVVILVGLDDGPDPAGRRLTGKFRCDPELGPIHMPRKAERGPRAERIFRRALLEGHAEEARLLYVAVTRARDRLVLVGAPDAGGGYAEWLAPVLEEAVEAPPGTVLGTDDGAEPGPGADGRQIDRPAAWAEDSVTGTGRQLDAFGFDHEPEDGNGQFSLFAPGAEVPEGKAETERRSGRGPVAAPPLLLLRRPAGTAVQTRLDEAPLSLAWLEDLVAGEPRPLVPAVPEPSGPFLTSATELRLREVDPEAWKLRYRHGVEPAERFAPEAPVGGAGEPREPGLSPTARGTLIHGVLERLEAEAELAAVLEETLAVMDAPELEEVLRPGTAYREALEREIRAVVRSPEWRWYLEGEPWRELRFLHVVGPRSWRQGAFDLFRPAAAGTAADAPPPFGAAPGGEAAPVESPWIIDFKTHRIGAEEVERVAAEYAVQARVYREAAEALSGGGTGGDPAPAVRVALHFTRPNVAVEV